MYKNSVQNVDIPLNLCMNSVKRIIEEQNSIFKTSGKCHAKLGTVEQRANKSPQLNADGFPVHASAQSESEQLFLDFSRDME